MLHCLLYHQAITWTNDDLFTIGAAGTSPREPHTLAWGPSCSHTKIFQLEQERLKLDEKITDSL